MSSDLDRHVRFYFGVSVSCLIPPNPHRKRDGIPDDQWEEDYLGPMLNDLKAKLSNDGFEIAFRKHVPVDDTLRLYAVDFVVSHLHRFPAEQVFTPRKNYTGFSVRKRSFSITKSVLEGKIADSLKRDYVVNVIAYEYAASRSFGFEVYMEGILELKHVIPSNEIISAGSVEEAINDFNSAVVDELGAQFQATPKTVGRQRPKDNVYKFDLFCERMFGFSEVYVTGDLVLMEKDMPRNEALMLGIDCDDDVLAESISWTELEIWSNLQSSSLDIEIVRLTLEFVDYDADFHDCVDELI